MKRYKKAIGIMIPSLDGDWVTFEDHQFEVEDMDKEICRLYEEKLSVSEALATQTVKLEENTALLRRIIECCPPDFLKKQCDLLLDIVNSNSI